MNNKLRSVNTKFWDDPFIEGLNPSEKLLFLYLITNPLTNLLGIYEITLKRISYDTGLSKETISKGFERFGMVKKAFYIKDNFIILPNWLKNQRLNSNMKVAVAREFQSLPINLKNSILTNGSERLGNDSEGFRMVMEGLGKYEIEIESEIEIEKEDEKGKRKGKFISPILNEVISYFKENGYSEEAANKAFKHYDLANWHDTNGKPVLNWKQKMNTVWFKDENKTKKESESQSGISIGQIQKDCQNV